MKIPLTIRMRFGQPMPFAFISIKALKYHVRPKPVWVLVDTGSPWTSITPYDAMMLNIPLSSLKVASDYPTIVFAGHKFQRLLLTDVTLRIKDETGGIASFDLPSISVLRSTKKLSPEKFKAVPSVLGTDFINTKGFDLRFNPSKGEAYLFSE